MRGRRNIQLCATVTCMTRSTSRLGTGELLLAIWAWKAFFWQLGWGRLSGLKRYSGSWWGRYGTMKSSQVWYEHSFLTCHPIRKQRSKMWEPSWLPSLSFFVVSEIPCHRMAQVIFMGWCSPLSYSSQEMPSQIHSTCASPSPRHF